MTEREHCRWCANEVADPRACTCPHDCGIGYCQAGTPAHIEGCGPGHNLLAYPSLACPACDVIAAHLEGGDGND